MLSYRKIEDYISFIESLFNNQWVTVLYSNSDEFIKVRGSEIGALFFGGGGFCCGERLLVPCKLGSEEGE